SSWAAIHRSVPVSTDTRLQRTCRTLLPAGRLSRPVQPVLARTAIPREHESGRDRHWPIRAAATFVDGVMKDDIQIRRAGRADRDWLLALQEISLHEFGRAQYDEHDISAFVATVG